MRTRFLLCLVTLLFLDWALISLAMPTEASAAQGVTQTAPTPTVEGYPAPRPPARIGSNASLVLGAASLLVIIVGGVTWSLRRKKTAH